MAEGEVFYRNRRAWRVRVAQAAVWVTTALMFFLTRLAHQAPHNSWIDVAIPWGASVFMIGCVVGVEVYIRLYVLEIRQLGDRLRFTTLATLHHRAILIDPKETTLNRVEMRGELAELAEVATEHADLHVRGRRLQFIADLTGGGDLTALERALQEAREDGLKRA